MRRLKYKYISQSKEKQENNHYKAQEIAIQWYNAEKLALLQMIWKWTNVIMRLHEIDKRIKELLNTSIS